MPHGYLITAILATLCTVVAITVPARPFVLGLASLLLGLVSSAGPGPDCSPWPGWDSSRSPRAADGAGDRSAGQ
jgi:hypothetical protein